MPQPVWWIRTISSVPSRFWEIGEGADLVIGDDAAGVPDHVSVTRRQAEDLMDIEARVHAGQHGQLLCGRERQLPVLEALGIALVVRDQIICDTHFLAPSVEKFLDCFTRLSTGRRERLSW